MVDANDSPTRTEHGAAQGGRPLGPRAQETHTRLLAVTRELLAELPERDVSLVEIARRAGTSPATFYQYFADVEEAVLELAALAAEETPAILALLAADWLGPEGLDRARVVVDASVRHWDENHAALLFRNVAAEQGDRRFRKVRIRALRPLLGELARKIAASREGRGASTLHPVVAAATLAAILERVAAHRAERETLGVSRADLVDTCARILHQTVTAGPAA